MPELGKVDDKGAVQIKFSSKIQPQSFSQVMYYLKKEQAVRGDRLLRELQNDQQVVTQTDELESVESLLKIAGCVQMELIPGTETNLDKKKFSWNLE